MRTASEGAAERQIRALLEAGEVGGLVDGRLLERFATGDGATAEAAFAALVERHGPMVWRACRAILADPNDADDAFQATFLVMVRRSRSLWVRDSVGPWLLQVARRTSMRSRSLARRRRVRELMAAGLKPRVVMEPPPDELGAAIHEEVGRLPERYRAVVVLCLLEGLPDSQAAARLGWPLGTVHSRLARGREKLRRGLTRRGIAPAVAALASSRTPTEAASAAVPARLIEATVRSASRLASLGLRDAALPAAVAALTEGVLRMTWLAKIQSAALSLAAVGGIAVAAALGSPGAREQAPGPTPEAAPPAAEPAAPASSVVDVVVRSASRPDFPVRGLGTVVASTPEATFVLTNVNGAEIASVPGGGRSQVRGEIRVAGLAAESVDVEPTTRLALLRFRPERPYPTARVLPRNRPLMIGQELMMVDHFEPGQSPKTGLAHILELIGTEPEAAKAGPPGVLMMLCDASPSDASQGGAGLFLKEPGAPPLSELIGVYRPGAGPLHRLFIGPEAIHRLLDRNGLGMPADAEAATPSPDAPTSPTDPKVDRPEAAEILASTVEIVASDHDGRVVGKGLGTVISSGSGGTIVLTSAHILSAREIGDAKTGRKNAPSVQVITTDFKRQRLPAQVLVTDVARGVAVLKFDEAVTLPTARIVRPNRQLSRRPPALRIDRTTPEAPLEVLPTTMVEINKLTSSRPPGYIFCAGAPHEGASGGGLFFAPSEPTRAKPELLGVNLAAAPDDKGFYASPDTIYAVLDAAGLTSLYADDPSDVPPPEIADSKVVKEGLVALAVEGSESPIALGTVISSTDEESLALTAGSIFAGPDGAPADPKRFGRKVTVYFARPRTKDSVPVPPVWGTVGEVVDFDLARNVGLVRFRPGRKLDAMAIVPTSWRPTRGASAFVSLNQTGEGQEGLRPIREASIIQKIGGVDYEAIECEGSPARTNVGAPLMILAVDAKTAAIAGVCNYSSPQDDAGYYAAPSMIYHILAVNGLTELYRKGNEAFRLAPTLPFKPDRRAAADPQPERIDRVERRVEEIDRKLDQILEALKTAPR